MERLLWRRWRDGEKEEEVELDVKVRTEGEQRGPSGSTAVKPLETKRRGSFGLGRERRPAFLAELSTAPESDCHLILPCAPLSWRGPTAQRTGTESLSILTPTLPPWRNCISHPYTSWKTSAHYSALETLPLNMNSPQIINSSSQGLHPGEIQQQQW